VRKKTRKHHKIFQFLLQKLIHDEKYDTEDLYILVELAQEWKLDFATMAANAGVSYCLESVPGIKPVGLPPPMPEEPVTRSIADGMSCESTPSSNE